MRPSAQHFRPLACLFVILALLVALLSLLFSNRLVKELAEEERRKMEVWAMATESIAAADEVDAELVLTILQGNHTIPVILYDGKSGAMQSHNVRFPAKGQTPYLRRKMEQFARQHAPIRLTGMNQLLYYDDSYTLKQLQLYPYLQLLVITLLLALAFFALNRSRRAEQNSVWVGLSKETAHQLGTPISSLVAWLEYLRLKELDPTLLKEIDKDVTRLQMISDRFSKIGSAPALQPADLCHVLEEMLCYLEKRVPGKVSLIRHFPAQPVVVSLNVPLFGWVIENLTRNAVDAIQGQGTVTFAMHERQKQIQLDVTDTGKGISRSKIGKVFAPGYTTKERGWGLGLSLVKRIVEVNHKGKIWVERSEPRKGTTFRIVLRK